MTAREAIAIVRDYAPTVTGCEKLHAALLTVAAVAGAPRRQEPQEQAAAEAKGESKWLNAQYSTWTA